MSRQTIDLADGETGMLCCPKCGSTKLLKTELRAVTFHATSEVTLPKDLSWVSFYCEVDARYENDIEPDGVPYYAESFTEEWRCASCLTELGSLDDIFRRYKNGETELILFRGQECR